jgi:pyridoxine 5-phosphate synthase
MKNPIRLGVNIDHVATVREARKTSYPDPVHAAILAEQAGADGITVHLREDKRHIQPRDVKVLKETIQIPLNFEMAAISEMVDFALKIKPHFCCIVPERREEVTTEGGLDVVANKENLKRVCGVLTEKDIAVSLFIGPDEKQIHAAKDVGATIIELHTGHYADVTTDRERIEALKALHNAAKIAHESGLQVNAGHGLHYHNVIPVAAIPEVVELNIGHALIGHAIMVGMTQAVVQMKALMDKARRL